MPKKKYIVNAMGMHSAKYGGLEKFLVYLAEDLNSQNICLIVILNSEPKSADFSNDLIRAGGKLIVSHALHPLKYFFTFIRIFIQYKPLLVHAHFQNYYSIIFARILLCEKVFTTIHGMEIDRNYQNIYDIRQLAFSTRLFRRTIYKLSDKIYTVSDALRKQYTILFPEVKKKIETLYLGSLPNTNLPELCHKKLPFQSDKVIIGTIGFNSPIKGMDILVDALVILKYELKCSEFIVYQIGIDPNDPSNKNLLNECSKKGLDDVLIWIGIRNDIPELLPGFNVYCQPSRSEALPLSLMEAGMAGLPVVGSNVGGIPEIILDNISGVLFRNGSVTELANCLHRLIIDPELRKTMGQKSREHVMSKFNIRTQSNSLCNKYLEELKFN